MSADVTSPVDEQAAEPEEGKAEKAAKAEKVQAPQEAEGLVSVAEPESQDETSPSDRIDIEAGTATLSDGTVVKISALKTRQFLKLMRIITRGGSNVLAEVGMNFGGDVNQFANQLVAVILFSIPEAEDETVEFVRSMVSTSVTGTPEQVKAAEDALTVLLSNPELDDTLTVVEAVVRREAPDLKALGRRVQQMLKVAEKVGEVPEVLKSV